MLKDLKYDQSAETATVTVNEFIKNKDCRQSQINPNCNNKVTGKRSGDVQTGYQRAKTRKQAWV